MFVPFAMLDQTEQPRSWVRFQFALSAQRRLVMIDVALQAGISLMPITRIRDLLALTRILVLRLVELVELMPDSRVQLKVNAVV